MISFIARKNGAVLWSYGNYQYEIEWKDGSRERFHAEYEDALKHFRNIA